MQELLRRLKLFFLLFLLVTSTGTVVFMFLEDLSFIDALYYNIVTMSTVGYGDIHPTSQASRIFAVLLIFMGGATFIGVIASTTEIIILRREAQSRERKVNMLLGVFFSEVGYELLNLFSSQDESIGDIRGSLLARSNWTPRHFGAAQRAAKSHVFKIVPDGLDMQSLGEFLNSRRGFLVGLLENPVLIEQEDFSETLLAVFHLADEIGSRDNLEDLPASDGQHLVGDMERAYNRLVEQWVYYLRHLKAQYPYLFSLAIRKNPFDPEATATVSG